MPRRRVPADRVVRTRVRETIAFPHLTERLALRLDAILHYSARSHFGPWHRILGVPDFTGRTGLFSPLVYVELETTQVRCVPGSRIEVRGESALARTVEPDGTTRHVVREGRHRLQAPDGALIAVARMINVFTRYDPDPARRRVRELPPELGLGSTPTRTTVVPRVEDLLAACPGRAAWDRRTHVWHYGQTDPNGHVNGVEYLRVMEAQAADVLHAEGEEVGRRYAARARIVYRKPCFRGDEYRCRVSIGGGTPLVTCGSVHQVADGARARPASVVELTWGWHEE